MHRRPSPLLHDYKPSGDRKPKKSKALQWFIVGLGLPLVGLFLVTTQRDAMLPDAGPTKPAMTSVDEAPIPEIVVTAERRPEPPPLPKFDELTLQIGRGDTLDKLFRQNNLNLGHLAMISQLDEPKKLFRRLKPGDKFEVTHDKGSVVRMYSELDLTSALQIDRSADGFTAQIIERPIEVRKRIAYGVIESSLFESGAAAGLSDKVIMNIAGIFAWDIDFVLDIRQGDTYYVQFEEIWQDGEFVTDGEIIVAEFNNDGRTHRAIRFIDDDGFSDYFTPDGDSVRKAFIRAPVDFTRISSNFNPRRRHPILNTIRAHRGVDYAAPRGTPIKAAGDGKVIFRGVKSGYGNTIILQHGGNITTLYAHMSGFAAQARVGRRVRQGQTIGYVGATGLATANHLHYEYRLNGVHRNPRTVELPQADPIDSRYRERFLASVPTILAELEQFKRMQVAAVSDNSD
ncbi:MAG: peptidoglycan DD-metalloendopeptidase family protein [Woeseiaceae bacterium]|nr:peptidoglycan DD-metalloendopeptidase family protein [Woeseiaceae bacterium]